ncbi:uncharacterized protein LOC135810103 [Sycon ciliatum]|uniref:uncharacterized protein LOC135810103 n=1 Tax=Sycon ciliatum TaxID=27933 RepID=UPI0031F61921
MSGRPVRKPKQSACTETCLPVERDDLTADSLACLVIAVLEAVLFERSQIPCVVKILRRVESQEEGAADGAPVRRRGPQRQDRSKFLAELQLVSDAMKAAVANVDVKSVMLMFGATTISAKEVYEVDISQLTRCPDAGQATNNDKLCRFSLLGMLASHVDWTKRLKPAKTIMRASVLLNIPYPPPEHLGLKPVRAFRIPRTAVHVRFVARGPGASRDQTLARESNAETVSPAAAAMPGFPVDATHEVLDGVTASDADDLASRMETFSVSSEETGSGSADSTATACAAADAAAAICDKAVAWYQIPVTLRGFSGTS